jgi:hypothetical protein
MNGPTSSATLHALPAPPVVELGAEADDCMSTKAGASREVTSTLASVRGGNAATGGRPVLDARRIYG